MNNRFTHVLSKMKVLWFAMVFSAIVPVLRAQTVFDTAQPRVLPPGAPRYSDVCMSSRWPRVGGTTDSFTAARGFHATQMLWVYPLNNYTWMAQVKQNGYILGGALNSTLPDIPGGDMMTLGRLKDINGNPIALSWLPSHVMGCANSDEYRSIYFEHARVLIDGGCDVIQMDDPHMNERAARHYGACYCEYCRDKCLAELGRDITTLTKTEMIDFQRDSVIEFHHDMQQKIRGYAGRYVAFSCNNAFYFLWDWCAQLFDYAMGETNSEVEFTPYNLYEAARTAEAYDSIQVFSSVTFSDLNDPHIVSSSRKLIGLSFALGAQNLAPWDVYWAADLPRYFGTPQEYADMYGFVRANPLILDDQESAYDFGPSISDSRWTSANRPALIENSSGQVCCFVRAVPGNPNRPASVHLVDWADTPSAFTLKLRMAAFYGSGEWPTVYLYRPPAYNAAVHEQAETTGDYSTLSTRSVLGYSIQDGFYVLNIPALDPWAVVVVERAPDYSPPAPNPPQWQQAPAGTGAGTVTMSAVASDDSDVEYYFQSTDGLGHDSGWQPGNAYTDSGLEPAHLYRYTVRTRDKSLNQNVSAAAASQTALTWPNGPVNTLSYWELDTDGYPAVGQGTLEPTRGQIVSDSAAAMISNCDPTWPWAGGDSAHDNHTSFYFDGSSALTCFSSDDRYEFRRGRPFTCEAFIRPLAGVTGTNRVIFGTRDLDSNWNGWYLRYDYDSSRLLFYMSRFGSSTIVSGPVNSVPKNVYHHVALVWDPDIGDGRFLVYVNGRMSFFIEGDPFWDNTPGCGKNFMVGGRNITDPWGFYGNIDEVRYTLTALEPAQFLNAFSLADPPDYNGSGAADIADLMLLMSTWLETGPAVPTDLNGDGIVDLDDFRVHADHWNQ